MWYEVRYLIAAPAMLALYSLYVAYYRIWNWAGWWLAPVSIPIGMTMAICNIAFNLTVGSFVFWERPKQIFFSDRIRSAPLERKVRYQKLLNPHDLGHIA
jgi:hypothetical protein